VTSPGDDAVATAEGEAAVHVPYGPISVGSDGVLQRLRLAAYAWAERESEVLLVRVAPTEVGAGLWTLPGGGLDFGEDPADGVLRELREETGLDGVVTDLLAVRSAILDPEETTSGYRIQAVGVLYRVAVTGGELRDEIGESTDRAAWIPLAHLDAYQLGRLVGWARGHAGG